MLSATLGLQMAPTVFFHFEQFVHPFKIKYYLGTIPFAPIVHPPNPSAGAAQGNNFRARGSNGYLWVEDLANTIGAKVIDVREI